ncbi:hypothetical protein [Acinetobacter sp. NIPH 542]|uniref:hypothetical protein n=1 Tax=Acinetobacter TaxID=469 RepID=UPI0002D06E44|nr:hypothetical protein F886_03572 [Acinetobacter sp. NIPH 542]
MTYTARLKVFCDNKEVLNKLNYTFTNTTTKQNYGGKLDTNGCTRVYPCNKLDLIFVELILNNSKLARIRVPALENGEFNKSTFQLKTTSGSTKQADTNKVPVKVKNELEIALDSLNGTAVYFGNNFLAHDSHLREIYIREVKKMSDRYLQLVKEGKMTVKEATSEATSLRNEILEGIRKRNSPVGRAIAEKEKLLTKTMDEFMEYYALQEKNPKLFDELKSKGRSAIDSYVKASAKQGNPIFKSLNDSQKNRVFYSILKGSGKTNAGFNSKISFMKWGGRAIVVFSVAYAGYEIYNAENKEKEIYRQGASIGAGIAGGAAGGAIAGGICGPGSPICSGIGILIGGAIGGIAAYQLVDAFDKELEAFTAWTVF